MKRITPSNKIYISKSNILNAERGVFASVDIEKGEIIEICPVIEITNPDFDSLGESILATYFYFFGKEKERLLIALGFGSIYNHSYAPNSVYKIKPKKRTIQFVSLTEIKKGEEITVNYNQHSPKSAPLWFEE